MINRLISNHPLQYAYESETDELIYNTGNTPTPEGKTWERFNRCPVCEQWSPCDVRALITAYEALQKSCERI